MSKHFDSAPNKKFSSYDIKKNFQKDLKRGKEQENLIKDLFEGDSFEIKSDYMAHTTGNIAIEIQCRGKDSGITTTESDHWVYKVIEPNLVIIFETAKLRKFVEDNMKIYRVIMGGDDNSSKMMLIPIREILNMK
jgi:hypothetical protein